MNIHDLDTYLHGYYRWSDDSSRNTWTESLTFQNDLLKAFKTSYISNWYQTLFEDESLPKEDEHILDTSNII